MDVLLPTILEYMPEPHLLCPGFRIVWDHVLELPHPHLPHHLPLLPPLQVLQVMIVDLLNGKEMIIATTKTTMMVAIMMVEIVAVTMSTPNTVLPVNVLILILEMVMMMNVKIPNPQHGVKTERAKESVPSLMLLTSVKKLVSTALV
jgi:hypothetical protein